MRCDPQAISAYYDGELSAAEQRSVAGHVSSCTNCRALLDSYRLVGTVVRDLPPVTMRVSLDAGTRARLDEIDERRLFGAQHWLGNLGGMAAAVLLGLGVGFVMARNPQLAVEGAQAHLQIDAGANARSDSSQIVSSRPTGEVAGARIEPAADVSYGRKDREPKRELKADTEFPPAAPVGQGATASDRRDPPPAPPLARAETQGDKAGGEAGGTPGGSPPFAPAGLRPASDAVPRGSGVTAEVSRAKEDHQPDGAKQDVRAVATPAQGKATVAQRDDVAAVTRRGTAGDGKGNGQITPTRARDAQNETFREAAPIMAATPSPATIPLPRAKTPTTAEAIAMSLPTATRITPDAANTLTSATVPSGISSATRGAPLPIVTPGALQSRTEIAATTSAAFAALDCPSLGNRLFADIYDKNAWLRQRLGCSAGKESLTIVAEMSKAGHVIYRGDNKTWYILGDDGTWTKVDSRKSGDAVERAGVEALPATSDRTVQGTVAEFQGGLVVVTGRGEWYVLFVDGSWQNVTGAANGPESQDPD